MLHKTVTITSVACLALVLAITGPGAAEDDPPQVLEDFVMYGVDGTSGQLIRHEFATGDTVSRGVVQTYQDQPFTGIEALAHMPGNLNIVGFWTDISDKNSKMLYINCHTARAGVIGPSLGRGQVRGAVALPTGSSGRHLLYAVQDLTPLDASGLININPNNSPNNEFVLVDEATNTSITRDDLHQDSPVDGDGTYYTGAATFVHVKPKGNGNQNGLIVDGQVFPLDNGSIYSISGSMQVRLFNDHIHSNGKAMGHWWVEIVSGFVIVSEGTSGPGASKIVRIDLLTDAVETVMYLERLYDGLAAASAQTFYATSGQGLYPAFPR